MALWLAVCFALAFSLTNGFHDAANAIATLVATRGARPRDAVVLSATFNMVGAVVVGTAVADTIGGIVTVSGEDAVTVIGAGALAATLWNVYTWLRGLPSSSGHALVGGLVGSAVAADGLDAVNWAGLDGWRPVGVLGVLVGLAVSPVLGLAFGFGLMRLLRLGLRRATRRVAGPVRGGQWTMSGALSLSHGANAGQQAMGVVTALLVAGGTLSTFAVPVWVKFACGAMLTLGTATGGWRIVRTMGRRIFRLAPLGALASETASTTVVLGAALLGAPVSTTQVVATSVVGVGGGRRRWRHVRWLVVRAIAFAWVATLPACALLGAGTFALWSAI